MPRLSARILWPAALVLVAILAFVFRDAWWPQSQAWVQQAISGQRSVTAEEHEPDDAHTDAHAHEGHDHAHDEASSLELTPQAMHNLGLNAEQLQPVKLENYARSITVPALVVERPGRTRREVVAPMTGTVIAMYAVPGAAITPGMLLFEMRLTHEDIVQAQVDFLRTLVEVDVENQEIERLRPLSERGVIAITTIREREYNLAKAEAVLKAQREALRLHGLSDAQVEAISRDRQLLRELKIFAPTEEDLQKQQVRQAAGQAGASGASDDSIGSDPAPAPPLVLQELKVDVGQGVVAGESLGVLVDYRELYIEGWAFEQDAPALATAVKMGWEVTAHIGEQPQSSTSIPGLRIAYLANDVDVESRTLHFYVPLHNEILRESGDEGDQRFVQWRYRPGQRMKLRVPVEWWEKQIVLPVAAVTEEGAESYVFLQNGDHFDRTPVHVIYRDQISVVVDADGSIFPGDVVALRGAHQMLMALKNKSGGGVDPHAGHNH